MEYEEIRKELKDFIMNTYDIRPSFVEETIKLMFNTAEDYIWRKEQVVENE